MANVVRRGYEAERLVIRIRALLNLSGDTEFWSPFLLELN